METSTQVKIEKKKKKGIVKEEEKKGEITINHPKLYHKLQFAP